MAQINKPTDYFNTVLYTGDDSSNRGITGVGFQPDLVWNKTRNQAFNHYLFDSVRGAGQLIFPNDPAAEQDKSAEFISFDSDGFSVTQNAGSLRINWSSANYANWCWLGANGTASNTDGSITSNVSANTTSGFSIVSYTGNATAGATIGHGLGVAPKMLIAKNRTNGTTNWGVWHTGIPINEHLILNGDQASSVYTGFFNNTLPSTSVVTLGNDVVTNGSGNNIILYCFAEKKGFSKFGSYTGNGSTDGTFVYTGFKPAWVMVKSSSAVGSWYTFDAVRNTFNPLDKGLVNNQSIPEFTFDPWDFTSNGFKARQNWNGNNSSGTKYIYMAFAENPLVGTNNIPAVAR